MAKPVTNKVFKVSTGMCGDKKNEDGSNWSSYTVIAKSGEEAIEKAKERMGKDEYVEEIECVVYLEE